MYRDIKLLVNRKFHNRRVDLFLKEKFPDASRKNIRAAFLTRMVLINGEEARKGAILSEGDTVLVKRLSSKKDIKYLPNLVYGPKIIYKDKHLATLYKPPFMHTFPANFGEKDSLANYAAYMFPGSSADDFLTPPLFLSRLDYETSGILVMARNAEAYQILREMEEDGEILKVYSLIVSGKLDEEIVVTNRIITTGSGKVRVDKNDHFDDGKYHTRFIPDEVFDMHTLVRAEIGKGRMHQIRAHASFAGFPILGDVKYGGKVTQPMKGLPVRPLLHSSIIEFPHLESKLRMKINCPYPEDLFRVLNHLQEHSDSSRS